MAITNAKKKVVKKNPDKFEKRVTELEVKVANIDETQKLLVFRKCPKCRCDTLNYKIEEARDWGFPFMVFSCDTSFRSAGKKYLCLVCGKRYKVEKSEVCTITKKDC